MKTTTNTGTILIVDDTVVNQLLLSQLLSDQGHKTITASTGDQAIEIVESQIPDLILLDILMPGKNGFEVCKKLKANKKTNAIPVIFMSALDEIKDKLLIFNSGGNDYITKPFIEEEVLVRVQNYLELAQLRAQLNSVITEPQLKNNPTQGEVLTDKYASKDITERILAEKAIESEHALLTALINSQSDVIIFSLDRNYCYTSFNKKHSEEMKRIWNVDIKLGVNLFDCMNITEVSEKEKQSIDRALMGEQFSEIKHQPNQDIYYEFNWSPIWQNKEIIGLTAFIKDITKHKKFEDELKESEEKFSVAFMTAPYAIAISEVDTGKFLEVNDSFVTVTGYSREEVLNNSSILLNLWVNTEDRISAIKELKSGKNITALEVEIRRKNGEIITGLFSAKFITIKNTNCILTTISDISKQRKLEHELKESEKTFYEMFHKSPVTTVLTIPFEGLILDVNDKFLMDLEFTRNEVIGRTTIELGVFENINERQELQDILKEKGSVYGFECHFRSKSGKIRIGLLSVAFIKLKGKLCQLSTIIDISDRKFVEENLKESERRLKEAQEMAHMGYWNWNIKTGEVEWSEEVFKIFGLDPKEFAPHIDSILAFSPWPEDHHRDQELIDKANESHDPGFYEQKILRPDNSIGYYYSTFQGNYDLNGGLTSIVGTVFDITQRKKDEEKLLESEDKYRLIAENTDDWIYWVNPDGTLRYTSPSCERITGYTPSEFISIPGLIEELVHTDDKEIFKCHYAIIKEDNPPDKLEFRIVTKHDEICWIQHSCCPIFTQKEGFVGRRATNRNITERKKAEENILKANRFLAIISQINQTIVYQRNKDELFKEVCRIITEIGKLQFVWIGSLNFETMNVDPVTFSGNEDGYLSKIKKISVIDIPEGQGPTGKAIREKKHFVCNDIELAPEMKIWRDEALKRDYHSSIALPIKVFGKVVNVLSIYSARSNFFDQKEIFMLDEVTKNIGFAIEGIETEERRKQAEEALFKVAHEWQVTFDNTNDIIWLLDDKQRILRANKTSEKLFKRSCSEIVGAHCCDIVHGLSGPLHECPFKNSKKSRIHETEELQIGDSWFRVSVDPIFDADDNYTGAVHIISDITERKLAEFALKESEQKFKNLIWDMQVGVLLLGNKAELLLYNPKAAELLRIPNDQLLGKTPFDPAWNVIQEDGSPFPEPTYPVNQAITTGQPIRNIVMGVNSPIKSDLVWLLGNINPQLNNERTVIQVVCTFIDITDRKLTENALHDSMEKYKILTNISPVGIFHTDEKGITTYVNPKWTQISGLSFEEALGDGWLKAVHPDDMEKLDRGWKESVQLQKTSFSDYRFVRPDGTIAWVMGQAIPEINEENKIVGFIGTITDITDRKKAEAILQESELRYRSLFENMLNGFAYCQMIYEKGKPVDYLYLAVNTAFESLTGLRNAIGKKVSDLIPGILETDNDLIQTYNRVALSGNPETFEIYVEALKDWYSISVYSPKKEFFIAIFDVITDRKLSQLKLEQQNEILSEINKSSTELSLLSPKDNPEAYITKKLKEIPGVVFSIFNEYDSTNRTTTVQHIEMESSLFQKVIHLLGKNISNASSYVSEEMYKVMTSEIIGTRKTLHEISFGAVSRPVGKAVQALLKVDRFIGMAYLIDGKLYGTSILAMKKGQPDPPHQLLESFIFMGAISIRRKQAEEELRQSEERYRSLLTNLEVGIVVHAPDTSIIKNNKKAAELLGLSDEQMIGKQAIDPFWKFIRENSSELPIEEYPVSQIIATKKPIKDLILGVVRSYDNNIAWITVNGFPVFDNKGDIIEILISFIEITERIKAEIELRDSEKTFSEMFHKSPVTIMLSVPFEGTIVDVNESFLRDMEYTRDEVIGHTPLELGLFNDPNERGKLVDILKEKKTVFGYECQFRSKNNKVMTGLLSITFVTIKGKMRQLSTVLDIDERKKAEIELRDSENTFSEMFHKSPVTIMLSIPFEGTIVDINESFHRDMEYTRDEVIGHTPLELGLFNNPDDRGKLVDILKDKRTVFAYECQFRSKSGKVLTGLISIVFVTIKGKMYQLSTILDIDERKKAEEALNNNNIFLQTLLDAIPAPVFYKNKELQFTGFNKAFENFYGKTIEELVGKTVFETYPAHLTKVAHDKDIELFEHKGPQIYESQAIDFSGNVHEAVYHKAPIIDANGQVQGLIGVLLDITERKSAEIKLRDSEERYRSTLDNMMEGCQIIGFDWRYKYINQAAINHARIDKELLLNHSMLEIYPNTKRTGLYRLIKSCMSDRVSYNLENEFVYNDGNSAWFELSIQPVNEGVFVLSIDITERKLAENALSESEQRFRGFVESASDIVFELTPEGIFTYLSPNFEEVLGIPVSEAVGKSFDNYIYPDDIPSCYVFLGQVLSTVEQLPGLDFRVLRKDGIILWHSTKGTALRDTHGNSKAYLGISRDITERKKNEEALRASEEKYRELINGMNETIFVIDLNGNITDVNNTAVEVLGYSRDELLTIGLKGIDSGLNKVEIEAHINSTTANKLLKFETSHKCKDGKTFPVEVYSSLVNYQGKQAILGIARDITERKESEALIKASEVRYRALFESAKDGILILDADTGRIEDANPFIKDLLGYTREELVDKELWKIDLFHDIVASQESFLELQKNDYIRYDDLPLETKDGQVKDVEFVSNSYKVGNQNVVQCNIRDITKRKHAEEALAWERYLLYALMENIPSSIYFKDIESRFIRISKFQSDLFGLDDPIQAVGKSDFDFFTKKHASEAFEDEQKIIKTGLPLIKEEQETWYDRPSTWVTTTKLPLYDKEDNIIGTFGISMDSTKRKLAEDALRESEEKFRRLLEMVPIPICYSNKAGEITFRNARFAKIIGYDEIEVPTVVEWWVKAYPDKKYREWAIKNWELSVKEAAETSSDIKPNEYQVKCNDGNIRYLIISGILINEDTLITFIDNTDRKKAEQEIIKLNKELEQRVVERTAELLDLYNHAPCGYHSLDKNGQVELINDTELEWLGYQRDEILEKRKITEIMTEESKQIFSENFQRLKENGLLSNLELELIRKDGTIMPVLLSATAIKDKDGNFLRSRSTLIDHTERKKAEKAIQETQELLKTSNKDLESFAYSVSHDLRAPLRHITGFIKLFLEQKTAQLTKEELDLLSTVSNSADDMGKLIDALLSFSRLNRAELQKSSFSTSQVIEKLLGFYNQEIKARSIEIIIKHLPETFGDIQLINQVWTNLISNAIKYTAKKEKAIIEIGGYLENSETIFYIKDNGAGFDMKYVDKLFGVFQRLHKARDFEGIGIGLANINRIVIKHGGRCWAHGIKEQGAEFYFSLPNNHE